MAAGLGANLLILFFSENSKITNKSGIFYFWEGTWQTTHVKISSISGFLGVFVFFSFGVHPLSLCIDFDTCIFCCFPFLLQDFYFLLFLLPAFLFFSEGSYSFWILWLSTLTTSRNVGMELGISSRSCSIAGRRAWFFRPFCMFGIRTRRKERIKDFWN